MFLLPLGVWSKVLIGFGKVLISTLLRILDRCCEGKGLGAGGGQGGQVRMVFLSAAIPQTWPPRYPVNQKSKVGRRGGLQGVAILFRGVRGGLRAEKRGTTRVRGNERHEHGGRWTGRFHPLHK